MSTLLRLLSVATLVIVAAVSALVLSHHLW